MKQLGKITEGTLIPISLVIVIIGGITWLTSIYYQGIANASANAELKAHVEQQNARMRGEISEGFDELKRAMAEDRKVTTQILFELRKSR